MAYQPIQVVTLTEELKAAIPEVSSDLDTIKYASKVFLKDEAGLDLSDVDKLIASPVFKQWKELTGYDKLDESKPDTKKEAAEAFANDFAIDFYNRQVTTALEKKGIVLPGTIEKDSLYTKAARGTRAVGGYALSTCFKTFKGVFGFVKEFFAMTLGAIGSGLLAKSADEAASEAGKYVSKKLEDRKKKIKEDAKSAKDEAKAKKEKDAADKAEIETYTSRKDQENKKLADIMEQSMAKALEKNKTDISKLREEIKKEILKEMEAEKSAATTTKKIDTPKS